MSSLTLFLLIAGICACTFRNTMANVPDPGANATSPTRSNPEDSIEVVLMSAIRSSSSEPFYDVSRLPILWTPAHFEILTMSRLHFLQLQAYNTMKSCPRATTLLRPSSRTTILHLMESMSSIPTRYYRTEGRKPRTNRTFGEIVSQSAPLTNAA